MVNRTLSLDGNAELQQDTSSVKGDKITFDMITEQLLATGSGDNDEGRVTTVFRPEAIRKLTDEKAKEDENNEDDN